MFDMALKTSIIILHVLCWFEYGHMQYLNQAKPGLVQYTRLVTSCCEHGIKAVRNNMNVDCRSIVAPKPSIRICRTAASICCMKQIQENMCEKGIQFAKTHSTCVPNGSFGKEDNEECCKCCHMGMEARRLKRSCRHSMLGRPCDKAYRMCCLSSVPLPTPGETNPTTQTTIKPTTKRPTCASLNCAQTCSILNDVSTCACRPGYKLANDKRRCNDVNECNQPDACVGDSEKCVNTFGSYKCTKEREKLKCPKGFELHPSGTQCQDIDECNQPSGSSVCNDDETCKNKPGSHECEAICPPSYFYRDEKCQKHCDTGYRWDKNSQQCKDIDECLKTDICASNQVCRNNPGSYKCTQGVTSCPSSHYLRDGICHPRCRSSEKWDTAHSRCTARCRSGEEWDTNDQRCKTRCRRGYEYDANRGICKDINECLTRGICGDGKVCYNVRGTYQCRSRSRCSAGYAFRNGKCERRCPSGYEWDATRRGCKVAVRCRRGYEYNSNRRTCTDINECSRTGICKPGENCFNRPGTYWCKPKCQPPLVLINGKCARKCPSGYAWNGSKRKCQDVDECTRNPCHPTNEVCVNSQGTYSCNLCQYGTRNVNGKCEDINECSNQRACSNDQKCINTHGGYRCEISCSAGYEAVVDNSASQCRDINECLRNPCRSDEVCENTGGSYRCVQRVCKKGFRLHNGKCLDINECEQVNGCRSTEICENTQGSYRCVICASGLQPKNGVCDDIDECQKYGSQLCNHECKNTYGAYYCQCKRGYKLHLDNRTCHDINECSEGVICPKNGYCRNTRGSFHCQCNSGYKLSSDGKTCKDVDECATGKRTYCEQQCININGSFYCNCNRGYRLMNDRRSCNDIDECAIPNQCAWRCQNLPGSYKCYCPSGYNSRSNRCQDIDECRGTNSCGNKDCFNNRGSYRCIDTSCPNQYFVRKTRRHCSRMYCRSDNVGCLNEKRKSIRWHSADVPNNAGTGSFIYVYNITTFGYRTEPTIRYAIEAGNAQKMFGLKNIAKGVIRMENVAPLRGPKEYFLTLAGEVVSEGEIRARFMTRMYISVSRYDFG